MSRCPPSPILSPIAARSGRCLPLREKVSDSLEEMVKDTTLEAIFVATDAPSHARHCMTVMKHGKDVACAVPAVFGSLDDAQALHETVRHDGSAVHDVRNLGVSTRLLCDASGVQSRCARQTRLQRRRILSLLGRGSPLVS